VPETPSRYQGWLPNSHLQERGTRVSGSRMSLHDKARLIGERAGRTQRLCARVAGFLFLWLILTGLAGSLTTSHIVGSGTFAETARRVAASEHLYRLALCSELIETLSVVLLAFALYITLKPVDKLLAQTAMYWRLGESFIGGVGMIFGFVRLRLYTSPQSIAALGADQSQALVGLTRQAGVAEYNISAIFFSIGSILFFYLFFKSRYIPGSWRHSVSLPRSW